MKFPLLEVKLNESYCYPWQIFGSAKVQHSISNLLKVEGFTTAVLRFSGDFESFRSLFHEKDISVPQNTIPSIHHKISRNFKHCLQSFSDTLPQGFFLPPLSPSPQ